ILCPQVPSSSSCPPYSVAAHTWQETPCRSRNSASSLPSVVPANSNNFSIASVSFPIAPGRYHLPVYGRCLGISHKNGGKHIHPGVPQFLQAHHPSRLSLPADIGNNTAHR